MINIKQNNLCLIEIVENHLTVCKKKKKKKKKWGQAHFKMLSTKCVYKLYI